MTIDERLAVVEAELRAVRVTVDASRADILQRLDGPPWERSIRGRLHALETDAAAAKVAASVLEEAKRERRESMREREQARGRKRGEWWKLVAAVTAAIAVLAPYIEKVYP